MTEIEQIQDILAQNLTSNYVTIEKFRIKQLLELHKAVTTLQAVIEDDRVVRGHPNLRLAWSQVRSVLVKIG